MPPQAAGPYAGQQPASRPRRPAPRRNAGQARHAAPHGPYILTADEVDDPHNLDIPVISWREAHGTDAPAADSWV